MMSPAFSQSVGGGARSAAEAACRPIVAEEGGRVNGAIAGAGAGRRLTVALDIPRRYCAGRQHRVQSGSQMGPPASPSSSPSHVPSESLWSTFDALARNLGDVEALLALDRKALTFRALAERIVVIRDCLAAHGIGPGDRVASVLPRGPETAVCFLGVASSSIYVPLNPDYSEAEFTRYLAHLRPKTIIVEANAGVAPRRSAAALGIPVTDLVTDGDTAGAFTLRFAGAPRPAAATWNAADDVGLILLTSGTTSTPKFVPIRQRHLLAYARASRAHYRLRSDDRGLHVMPMFHGHGLKAALFVPLACGSGVICSGGFDISRFFRQIVELQPTWYSAAASIHQAVLQHAGGNGDAVRAARLRFIRSGSARLDPRVMEGLEDTFGAPVVERYGMTETCTLTANPLPPAKRRPGSVGTPMFNDVAIIDESGNAVAPGRVGEVVARGAGVFDGYLDDPVATAAAFRDGWFRTGDLGRFDDDGYLTLAGRLKDVINRGGEKIGTMEVESALLCHPALAEACVFPIPHPTLGEEVGAAVVRAPGLCVTERELRAYAATLLAGFKIPRRISFLPQLPRGTTSKVDREAVARLCVTRFDDAAAPPRAQSMSALEAQIAEAWSDVLNLRGTDIARDDDFFLLGGDSLQAYELFARLRARYGITVGLGHLFDDAATVAGMARLVERSRESPRASDGELRRLVRIKAEGDRPPLFAIPGSGGNPVGFVHLGRLLDRRQPLIGIESRGIDGRSAPLTRVEVIAADNLQTIRKMQPVGPYYLAGACYGARVAYEMARQLEMAGERVGLLLMLDPSSPFHRADGRLRGESSARAPADPRRAMLRFLLGRVKLHASSLARLRGRERIAYLRGKIVVAREIIRDRDLFRGDRSELHQRLVYAANREAGQRYVPGSFAGKVVLCFTRDRPVRGERNYRLDWLEVLPQSGGPRYVAGHDSGQMLSLPHVYELAVRVNGWLDDAHRAEQLSVREPADAV
jgi:acyl-CoA synthetase (AMP-forming)/AMP-acid ligase II/thioesterase domain-containing protein/acyl carrier protein